MPYGEAPLGNLPTGAVVANPSSATSVKNVAEEFLLDPVEIEDSLKGQVDLVVDVGLVANEVSTVVDLSGPEPVFLPAVKATDDPRFASDAWTRLDAEQPGVGTRAGLRSLDAVELRRSLAVGACLPCHEAAADRVWRDFATSKARLEGGGTRCTFRAEGRS